MNHKSVPPGALDGEMSALREALESRRLSLTPQRLEIAREAFTTHEHFTAEELYDRVRKRDPRVGRMTVYRTLAVLVEAGLVEERAFSKERVHYEHVVGHPHHDHMVCVRCGRILEFSSPRIEKEQDRIAKALGFRPLHHQHTLFGMCRACDKKQGPERKRT